MKNHHKQMINAYSYNSGKINLNWLFIIVIAYLLLHNAGILISIFKFLDKPIHSLEHLSSGVLLVFVFVLGIFGFRQNQLTSVTNSPKISAPQIKAPAKTEEEVSDKYKHSSLKEAQANAYMQKIIDYINASAIWKDNELSIDKISAQTGIPKYYISQVLNEKVQKNFYTFINEYRIEYAMKLIKSPEHKNWSFVAIAFESGFNSKSVFNSFFKKHTGMTPTEYKNKEVG
ncbi:helix-turn-helix domain-containing protein [Plebeiibacterium marinum]|uniref:AraC family transcriptional regulator n=1 Tax=Plebeiibacterium marinum TaxID=2992111 RepID=A0AAE3MCA3_9BACT|nr:AraC family transcriptional regulator [Plebeiobacterium marinum]MCW3804527.1 AraC family transcriptional regulator [Plebeiobacterium marinum]